MGTQFKLKIATITGNEHSSYFSTEGDAIAARAAVLQVDRGAFCQITPVYPDLNGKEVTEAMVYAVKFMVDLNKRVDAIKFLRMSTGAGLKEAKDWLDEQFQRKTDNPCSEVIKPDMTPGRVTLGELLRSRMQK